MTGMVQGSFDASQFKPKQGGGGGHPIGNGFDFTITNTSIEPTKDQSGGMFIVEFTSPQGTIVSRYNLWNKSEKAVAIAHGELSALCHATGIFRLDFANDGAALRGGRGKMDVGLQNANEPDGYVEVKKVYDANGNEPGKNPTSAPQPSAPMQNNNGGWGNPNPAPQQQPPQQQAPQGWNQQQPQNQSSGGASPPTTPPWGR